MKNSNMNAYSNLNDNQLNEYRRKLITAKLVISELQDKNLKILSEKQQIESQLNEALNSIKSLHNDYIILTEKFALVNKNITIEQNNNTNEDNENIRKPEEAAEFGFAAGDRGRSFLRESYTVQFIFE